MSEEFYRVLHVVSVILLTAFTFQAFAAPAEARRRTMMYSGIASLLVLVGGFGLLARLGMDMASLPAWLYAKIACWLVLSAIGGMAFRRPGLRGVLTLVTLLVVTAGVYLVYLRPF